MTRTLARDRSFVDVREVVEQLGIYSRGSWFHREGVRQGKISPKCQEGPHPATDAMILIVMGRPKEFPLRFQHLRIIWFLYPESVISRSSMRALSSGFKGAAVMSRCHLDRTQVLTRRYCLSAAIWQAGVGAEMRLLEHWRGWGEIMLKVFISPCCRSC